MSPREQPKTIKSFNTEAAFRLSKKVENLLVEQNLRGMKTAQSALRPGYCARASQLILTACESASTIIIGTGFPVISDATQQATFETDGPVGAIALYNGCLTLGAKPVLACAPPLADALADDFNVLTLIKGLDNSSDSDTQALLAKLNPGLLISIERPGKAADGRYYNMRGEDISDRAACFDRFVELAKCPSIGIGDGGNEIGMGTIKQAIATLDIEPCTTETSELVVADVSNWAALGLIAMLDWHEETDLLSNLKPVEVLQYLSDKGSVDGVTRLNQLTEDGMPAERGLELIKQLNTLINHHE